MENLETELTSEQQPVQPPSKSLMVKTFLMDVLETLVFSAALFLIINMISARIRIESISMQPTLYEGDFVIVNRLAYKLGEPGRGDIIVFRYPPDPEREPYIKRVIGLPGETVSIHDGRVFVNDVLIRESYIKASPSYMGEWLVPEGELFVLGDNRNYSSDSHSWGMVPLGNVIGKAEVVYAPVSHWQLLKPRVAAAAEP